MDKYFKTLFIKGLRRDFGTKRGDSILDESEKKCFCTDILLQKTFSALEKTKPSGGVFWRFFFAKMAFLPR